MSLGKPFELDNYGLTVEFQAGKLLFLRRDAQQLDEVESKAATAAARRLVLLPLELLLMHRNRLIRVPIANNVAAE